jgi:hypothetical protein
MKYRPLKHSMLAKLDVPIRNSRSQGELWTLGIVLALCCGIVGQARAQAVPASQASGAEVYKKYCASCHDQVTARIPTREALTKMSPARILRTLDFGLMMSIAYPIRRDEREAVAKFLGKGADETAPPPSAFCKADRPMMSGPARESWTGWGRHRPTRDFKLPTTQS